MSHYNIFNIFIFQLCSTLQADDISTNFKTTKQADKNAQKVNLLLALALRLKRLRLS